MLGDREDEAWGLGTGNGIPGCRPSPPLQGRLRNLLTQDTVTHVTLQCPELHVELGAEVLLPGQPTSTHPIRASSAGSSSRSLSWLVCPGNPNLQPRALGLPLFSLRLPPLRVLLSCFWPQVPRADRGVRARRNPPSTGSSTWRAEHQPTPAVVPRGLEAIGALFTVLIPSGNQSAASRCSGSQRQNL